MLNKLKETNHSYYCNNNKNSQDGGNLHYKNWKIFEREWGLKHGIYFDVNLLFRFDICKDDNNSFSIKLFFIMQRKGISQCVICDNLTNKDLPKINAFLDKAHKHLFEMWDEFKIN